MTWVRWLNESGWGGTVSAAQLKWCGWVNAAQSMWCGWRDRAKMSGRWWKKKNGKERRTRNEPKPRLGRPIIAPMKFPSNFVSFKFCGSTMTAATPTSIFQRPLFWSALAVGFFFFLILFYSDHLLSIKNFSFINFHFNYYNYNYSSIIIIIIITLIITITVI